MNNFIVKISLILITIMIVSACQNQEAKPNSINKHEKLAEHNNNNNNNNNNMNEKDNTNQDSTPNRIDMSLAKKCKGAKIHTNKGDLEIILFNEKAPITVANFCTLAKKGFYDGIRFHRIINGFVIQVGDPLSKDESKKNLWGTGGPGYKFKDELPKSGEYEVGSLAMANSGPDTNGSQFFIVSGRDGVNLPPLYSLFGKVTKGLDIVEKIQNTTTDSYDRPTEDIVIEKIDIIIEDK